MKKILGRVIALLLLASSLFAGVSASVDKDAIYSGDVVNYTISAEGKNPKFPNLNTIAGYGVMGVSTSQSVNVINGNYKSTISKTYSFAPTRSLIIPSYKVKVDGKEYKTDEIKVTIVKPSQAKSGSKFAVSMKMDKNDVFVGEPIKVDVIFKYRLDAQADKIMITPLKISDFWIKSTKKPSKTEQGDTVVQTYHYLIFPQKQGDFEIKPIEVNIGMFSRRNRGGNFFNDPFFDAFDQTLEWRKIISNKLFVHVKPLPNNLEVYGKYNINASVDKTEVKANKPVNLTIKIDGVGNIDDIKKFSLDIDNVVAYSDEPKIRAGLNGGVYGGVFTQKVALIADKDFTIPPIKFSYFDKDLKKLVTKETKPVYIKIKGGNRAEITPKISTSQSFKSDNKQTGATPVNTLITQNTNGYLYLFVGILLGILASMGYVKFTKVKISKVETPIIKKIKKTKGDKELFEILLPYGKDDDFIKTTLERLEENIYGAKKSRIDKKEIIQHFLDLD
ncbi:MAG: BatD family protein [Sulfurospirillum sp.]